MEIELTIMKFTDVSKRREIKRPTWFAIDNDIFSHPDFFKLTGEEFRCWIWILSVASKVNNPKVRLNSEIFAYQCRCKEKVFFATIEKLRGKRIEGEISPPEDHASPIHYTTDTTYITNTTLQNSSTTVAKEFAPVAAAIRQNEPISFVNEKDLIGSIPLSTLDRWSALYPDSEFLNRESIKAFGYYENNPTKKPKTIRGWVRALSSWFERGWPKYAASIKGTAARANLDEIWGKEKADDSTRV